MPYAFLVQGGGDLSQKAVSTQSRETLTYRIIDAASDFDALLHIDAIKPAALAIGLTGTMLVFDELRLKHVEAETYDADITYIHPDKQESQNTPENNTSDEPQITINTVGSSQHITHSIKTLRSYPSEVKDKHKQAINVERTAKGEVKVKGTDTPIAAMKITISAKIPPPADPFEFGRKISRRSGKTNRSTYRGFTKWELMFLGAKIAGKRREKWMIDYEFEGSETIEETDNFKIADFGPIVKEGHAYLWVEHQQSFKETYVYNPTNGQSELKQELVVEPVGVFIEQVALDFELSEIGLT